jgi:DNA polymerase-3 subunit delta'
MYSFDRILGNEHIKENLQAAIKAGRVSHAFIFSGQAGTGRKLIAYTLANALNCLGSGAPPCGSCTSCRTLESGNNPDIITVRPKGKSIGIDEVRELITLKMQSKPYSGKYKVFVIEDADKLTVSAQNALLKTMEEPAHYGIFLLVCENYNSFLNTIISRAIVLNVQTIPLETVAEYLRKNYSTSYEESEIFAAYSEGSIGKAVSLAVDDEFKNLRAHFLSLKKSVESGDAVDAIKAAEEMASYKEKLIDGLNVLYLSCRDALVYKSTGREDLLIERFLEDKIKNYVADKTPAQLMKKLQSVEKAKTALLQNANVRLTLEVMLFKFKEV